MIQVLCDNCNKTFSVGEENIGKKGKCGNCGKVICIDGDKKSGSENTFLITQEFSLTEQRYVVESYIQGSIKKIYLAVRNKDVMGGFMSSILSFICGSIIMIYIIGRFSEFISELYLSLYILTMVTWVLLTCVIFILIRPKRHCYIYSCNDVFQTDEDPNTANMKIREIYSIFGRKKYKLIERGKEIATIYKTHKKYGEKGTWQVYMGEKIVIDADNGLMPGLIDILLPMSTSMMRHHLQSFTIYHTELAKAIGTLKFGSPRRKYKDLGKERILGDKYILTLVKGTDKVLVKKIIFCLSILLDYGERR